MDELGYAFFFGIFIGAAATVILAFTPVQTYVEQGFLESKGKVYRVVPAEVVEKRGE